ncbi:MAG: hypothetical protein F6J87_08650 [Spirulina sp. SIO3F2]|nr:hypothetical protein [Spirulina sp. SIO3F2]
MTVSQTDIQELIAEVDQLLWATDEANPDMLIEPAQYQAVLEKVRWCLSNLVRQVEVPDLEALPLNPPEQQTAEAIARAVMAQMNLQRQAWLQPMQLELETVRQQRETLRREIHHLETQQRQMSHELLQTVMHRCSEALKQELATVFDRLQGQFSQTLSGTPAPNNAPPALQQLDWLEKLRSLEQQADQLFLSLDQTFHQVFNSLEQDVQSYHQSLRHKLGQIHELQNQTLLTPGDRAEALPHQSPAAMSPRAVDSALPWQSSPVHEMPLLQLDQGEPLPALEPLITGEFVEPVEQVLQLDLNPQVSAPSQQHTVSSDQAWEAWDEYLFNYDPGQDEPLSAPDLSRVLTVDLPQPDPKQPPTAQDVPLELPELEPAADLPREVQQELFANLSDPATVTEPERAENSSLPPVTAPVAGTVLFGDPAIDPEAETLTTEDLAGALDPDEATESPGPTLEETIASLDDLLEQVSARMAETTTDAETSATDSEADEGKISPGETLLTTAEFAAQPSGQLDAVLDAQKMDQLSADLASFEAEAPAQAELEHTESEPTASAPPNPVPASPIPIPSTTEAVSEPVTSPSSSQETSSSNSSTQPDTDRASETTSLSAASAHVDTEAMTAAPNPVVTPEPASAVPSMPDSTPQSVVIPEPEATTVVAPSSSQIPAPEPARTNAVPPVPEPSEHPTQTDAVSIPPPATIAIETTPSPSSAAATDPTIELPAHAVLSSLSDLDWKHNSAESLTTDDAQADLWGEQRPSVSIASGQNG